MFIFFGTRGRITPTGTDTLEGACPQCSGPLKLSSLKRWFTLYFIPIFPFQTVDTFYYCKPCDASYKQEAREKLVGTITEREEIQKRGQRLFFRALIACKTYMALIDGKISTEEKALIQKTIDESVEWRDELKQLHEHIISAKDSKDEVYTLLRQASEVLTTDGILFLLASVAKVLLADGAIDPKEEALMKEFLLVCGASTDLYGVLIEKTKLISAS